MRDLKPVGLFEKGTNHRYFVGEEITSVVSGDRWTLEAIYPPQQAASTGKIEVSRNGFKMVYYPSVFDCEIK